MQANYTHQSKETQNNEKQSENTISGSFDETKDSQSNTKNSINKQSKRLKDLAQKAFLEADGDKDGQINKKELFEVVHKLCLQFNVSEPSNEEVEEILSHYDENCDGVLQYEEFEVFILELFNFENFNNQSMGSSQKCKMMNRIFEQDITPKQLQEKQFDVMMKVSKALNLEFNQMMKSIEETKRKSSVDFNDKHLHAIKTKWQEETENTMRERRQTLDQYHLRLIADSGFMKDCIVKKRDGYTAVFTSMGGDNQ